MIRRSILACFLMGILFISFLAISQEAILAFVLRPETVVLPPGATISAQLVAANHSVYEAEELEFNVTAKIEGLTIAPLPSLELLNPYNEQTFDFSISAATDLSPGVYPFTVEAIYGYCIDVSCFQIIEVFEFEVNVVEGSTTEAVKIERPSGAIWTWLIPALLILAVVGAGFLSRLFHTTLLLYLVLALIVFGGLVYGLFQDQHEQARAIGSVLCTSCVGIEETRHAAPVLSSSTQTALAALQQNIELLVFHAPWCRSCPYAEAMVAAMGAVTDSLTYQSIDVEERPDLAIQYGVVRSDRMVIPAIVRRDTGEVIFGVDDLEARLLSLLGAIR